MCEFCTGNNSQKVSVCKKIEAKKTASKTDIKDCQIFIYRKESPCLMIFDRFGHASYIDINYCPICGRKLTEVLE